jgi:hypothetical protein
MTVPGQIGPCPAQSPIWIAPRGIGTSNLVDAAHAELPGAQLPRDAVVESWALWSNHRPTVSAPQSSSHHAAESRSEAPTGRLLVTHSRAQGIEPLFLHGQIERARTPSTPSRHAAALKAAQQPSPPYGYQPVRKPHLLTLAIDEIPRKLFV